MARIPYPEPAEVPASLAPILADQINVFRMAGHSPILLSLFSVYSTSLLTHTALGARERELVILACAQLYGSDYEWRQHLRTAPQTGLTGSHFDALAARHFSAPVFTEHEQVLLEFVTTCVHRPRPPAAVLNRFRARFSDRHLVEILALLGNYLTIARLSTVLEVEVDVPEQVDAAAFWDRANGLVDSLIDRIARQWAP
ncbi:MULTISPECIES: carboxymuconolactone decarboxylase family protein [Nocardia]|uniref:Carboxymuconolactone decarboxylase-like domain-containing protein n=2 Tax=Nocardia TaxID=1817 RepID=K0F1Q5_NOCB7|nr:MULTISPECIES: carboxymuconolactone decarboxylase family protein [Nocardia]AFU01596.1 hypothetical protein O3I_018185 [Nocardia brasiliensis ATCC 700358]